MKKLELEEISVNGICDILKKEFMGAINYVELKNYVIKNLLHYVPQQPSREFDESLNYYKKHYLNNKITHRSHNEEELSLLLQLLSTLIFDLVLLDAKAIAGADPSQRDLLQVLNTKTKGLVATTFYRVANFMYYENLISDEKTKKRLCRELMERTAALTSIDIHPAAKIGQGLFIDHGSKTVIGETCEIGNNCTIFNDVVLGSKNVMCNESVKRHPSLGNNVTICAGCRVLGNIKIGNNVFISPACVVLEDIEENSKVTIVNQLQLTNNSPNILAQKMVVYGVVPKFKNTLMILGEGFYNPMVLVKLKEPKDLFFNISFWDKNKIILKFKNKKAFSKAELKNSKIIILSNNNKVVLLQNFALEKTLTTLS